MGTLYVVATPIGNLEDISIRALKIILDTDIIACEDTRRTGLLIQKFKEIHKIPNNRRAQLISYYEQNEAKRIPEVISFIKSGLDVVLISDAGTPLISDPGFKLVRECVKEDLKIVSIPGASSVLTALTSSGLPTDKFTFGGYPPLKSGHRKTFFEKIKKSQESLRTTVVLFEAPHKLIKTLIQMKEIFGDIDIVLARELTKIHEEILHDKISVLSENYLGKKPKGEFVILFNLGF